MPVDQLGIPSLGPELQKFPHRGGFLSAQTCGIGSPGALLLSVLGFKAGDPFWLFGERFMKVTDAEANDHVVFVYFATELQVVSSFMVYVGLLCMFYIGKYILRLK